METFHINHYEKLSEHDIRHVPGQTGLPREMESYLNSRHQLGRDGIYYSLGELGEEVLSEQWQAVKDENGSYVQIPGESVALRSTFEETVVPSCCGQKQNEETYRTRMKEIFEGLKSEMRDTPDDGEFMGLVENKRLIAANSDAYNRVLRAGERFHRRLLRGDMEETELVSDAYALYEACAAYIFGHPSPFFPGGKERRRLVAALQGKAQAVTDRHLRDGDTEFCAKYVLAWDDGKRRRAELVHVVEAAIRSWSMEGNDQLISEIKACMMGGKEEIAKKYLHYFFPNYMMEQDRRSKEKQEEALGQWTDAKRLEKRLQRFLSAMDETMGDVMYWAEMVQAAKVRDIQLTGSDLHERGIGVVIVTFVTGAGEQKKVLKPELKQAEYELLGKAPEGAKDSEKSVAERLNDFAREGGIKAGKPDDGLLPVTGEIRTLDIQLSRDHGTMVEMVEHVQIQELKSIAKERILPARGQNPPVVSEQEIQDELEHMVDTSQVFLSEIFCMLVGMSDMHHENFVYEKAGVGENAKYRAVLIDADNALSAEMLGNEAAGGQEGMVENYLAGKTIVIDKISELVSRIKEKLSEAAVTTRTVPIFTATLDFTRSAVQECGDMPGILEKIEDMEPELLSKITEEMTGILLGGRSDMGPSPSDSIMKDLKEERKKAAEELWAMLAHISQVFVYNHMLSEGFGQNLEELDRTPEQKKAALLCAMKDFMAGQIPFYEFHPETGKVTTHKGTVEVASAADVSKLLQPIEAMSGPDHS